MMTNEELARKVLGRMALFMGVKWTVIILAARTARKMAEK